MQPTYVSALPGTTDMVTPIAKSMSVTQTSQMPVLPIVPPNERDILEPMSSALLIHKWASKVYLFGKTDARYE